MRFILLLLLVVPCFGLSLDDDVYRPGNYQNQEVRQWIKVSTEAIAWLDAHPEYPDQERWIKKIVLTELHVLASAMCEAIRYRKNDNAALIVFEIKLRLAVLCPTMFDGDGIPVIDLNKTKNINKNIFVKYCIYSFNDDENLETITLDWAKEILKVKNEKESGGTTP